MKPIFDFFEVIITTIILTYLISFLTGCGSARGDSIYVQTTSATDGTVCYYLIQNGEARGLSCK